MKCWLAGSLWLALSCAPKAPEPTHIVLVVMDTVRQDHLSCYGYQHETTPWLKELGKTSTVFDSAHSTSGWTSPAHASMFTGLFPIAHQTTQENWVLGEQFETLAELLSEAGYETVGMAENPMLSKRNGFDQGFDAYQELWREEGSEGLKVVERFAQTIAQRDVSKPLFTFVNLMGAHSPYRAGSEFTKAFVRDSSIRLRTNLWREYFLGEAEFVETELAHLRELYDAEIAFTDSLVRALAEELKAADLWDQTVFVVTSDHGENIGDHELMDHVFSLYESSTKVPLIIHDPKHFVAGRESRSVQLTDLFWTLIERAGVEQEFGQAHGRSLTDLRGDRPVFCEYYYPKQALLAIGEKAEQTSRLDPYRRRLRSIERDGLKLIWGSDDRHELYDLNSDPDELSNLIEDEAYAEKRAGLERLLTAVLVRLAPGGDPAIEMREANPDEETLRALRKIGYAK